MGLRAMARARDMIRAGFCRRRAGVALTALVSMMLHFPAAATAPAEEPELPVSAHARPPFRTLDLVVDPDLFEEICELLLLTADQKAAARESFALYYAQVRQLDEELTERVLDAGLRESRQLEAAAYRAGEAPSRARIDTLYHQWHETYVKAVREGDSLLNQWLEELKAVLEEDQLAHLAPVPRLIRRRAFCHYPEQAVWGNFRVTMDLHALLAEASEEGEELAWLKAAPGESPEDVPEPVREARGQFQAIITDYEVRLDAIFLEKWRESRAHLKPSDRTLITDEEAEGRRRIAQVIAKWRRRYDILDDAVEQIAVLLETNRGLAARQAWEARFNAVFACDIYAERWPDRMLQWLENLPDETPEQLQQTQVLYEEYIRRRRELRRQAVVAGVRVRKRYLIPVGEEPLKVRYVKRLAALEELTARTIDRFRGMLTSDQAERLDAHLERQRALRPYLFKPST
ncbi:MAG: hypothetical protein GF355_06645 [Candidatus Eisenbacteria bacterium]|nr:hypothetical protein [Candidatus Eisenbacteria bacterium]